VRPSDFWKLNPADPDDEEPAYLALTSLLEQGTGPEALELALKWATESGGDAQGEACELLRQHGGPDLVPALEARFRTGGRSYWDANVDEALGATIAHLAGARAEPFLLKQASRKSYLHQLGALAGLRYLDEVSTLEPVVEVASREGMARASALVTLLAHEHPKAWALVDAADDDDRELCLLRAGLFDWLDLSDEVVRRLGSKKWTGARALLAEYLLERKDRRAVAALEKLAARGTKWEQLRATAHLTVLNPARHLGAFIAVLDAFRERDLPAGEGSTRETVEQVSAAVARKPALKKRWAAALERLERRDC
jgi:hypothetical protein